MFAFESVRLLARIVKVSALRSTSVRTMATGGALTDAGPKNKVALITGITGQVGICMLSSNLHETVPWRQSFYPILFFCRMARTWQSSFYKRDTM